MKRFVSLILAVLLICAAASAASLQWDFTTNNDSVSYVSSDYVLISGGDCHVRSFPNIYGGSIGILENGETANCLGGKSTDSRGTVWYEIDYNGMSGWVSSEYAYLNGEGAEQFYGYVRITGGDCNMRGEPNLNGAKITVLKSGYVADYLGETSTDDRGVDWYYVSYNGKVGWVSSKYAVFTDSAEPVPSSPSYGYVKATSHKVNLRDEPGLYGEDIGTMDKGETATYLGSKSTDARGVVWYKVRFNGKTGWVSSRYSKLYD